MASIELPPNLSWRAGRPRWTPGPTIRRKGWKPRDLKDEAGRWLGLDAAVAAVKALNAEVTARHAAGFKRAPAGAGRGAVYSLEQLFEDLWRSPKFTTGEPAGKQRRRMLAGRTLRDYQQKAHALRDILAKRGKRAAGRLLDGRTHNAFPEVTR